jgi:hypothetical protein
MLSLMMLSVEARDDRWNEGEDFLYAGVAEVESGAHSQAESRRSRGARRSSVYEGGTARAETQIPLSWRLRERW